jgi:hypothetical protein
MANFGTLYMWHYLHSLGGIQGRTEIALVVLRKYVTIAAGYFSPALPYAKYV